MREIEFRAWDIKHQQMYSWEELDQYDKDDVLLLFELLKGEDPNLIPLEFTGLKDKNGKKIFEGDIVRLENSEGDVVLIKIVWQESSDDNIFWAGLAGEFIRDVTDEVYSENGHAPEGWTGEPEVIGTIYQNPELLKGD